MKPGSMGGGIAQVALCTADLPATIRMFVEGLGFADAGGRARWGAGGARLQELPTGDETTAMMWWLVGGQEFVQVELFQHTRPRQRPRPADWRPSDVGWVRFGVTVADIDLAVAETGARTGRPDGRRRACMREPGSGAVLELIEDAASPPALAYVAASVLDLDSARRFFGDTLGFGERASDALHDLEDEALWGLPGARRRCAVFDTGPVALEVVQYEHPAPRRPRSDALLSDQGIMNVAIGYRDRDAMGQTLERALRAGATATSGMPETAGGVYLRTPDGLSVELLLVPPGLDTPYGFTPRRAGDVGYY